MRLHLPLLTSLAILLTLSACGPRAGGSSGSSDNDGDLLSNDFEESIGTDPDNADTDGDGFEDGEEYVNYFSPTKDDDYPYTNADYPRTALPNSEDWDALREAADADEDMGRGWDEGEFSKSWAADDQYGDNLLLKRFYGQVVVIDISAEWCPPCRAAALTFEDEWQELKDHGVMMITVLGDGLSSADSIADRWAQWPTDEYDGNNHPYGSVGQYGGTPGEPITAAIIEDGTDDPTEQDVSRPWLNQTNAFPSYVVLDRNHVIQSIQAGGSVPMGLIEELAAEDYPEVDYPLPDNVDEIREAFPGAGSVEH